MGGGEDETVVAGDDKSIEGPEEELSCCVALEEVCDETAVTAWGGSRLGLLSSRSWVIAV